MMILEALVRVIPPVELAIPFTTWTIAGAKYGSYPAGLAVIVPFTPLELPEPPIVKRVFAAPA